MNTLGRFLRQFWPRSTKIPKQVFPASKPPASSRQHPFAFRRAMLREALTRLKQMPLDRGASLGDPKIGLAETSAASDDHPRPDE